LKKNADGPVRIMIQRETPGPELESTAADAGHRVFTDAASFAPEAEGRRRTLKPAPEFRLPYLLASVAAAALQRRCVSGSAIDTWALRQTSAR
jgi:hypothetical protein